MADHPLAKDLGYLIGRQETLIRTVDDVHAIVSKLAEPPPSNNELGELLKTLVEAVKENNVRGMRIEAALARLLEKRR